jgi:hypothetical protein
MIRTYKKVGSYEYYRALYHTRLGAFVLSLPLWAILLMPAVAGGALAFVLYS